ncbi:hypothetical protein HK101_006709 [Irineochytrium annulatum]|nr:hypothetical protein HK101_006709 [Irineochytrium annulatum]
MGRMLQTVDSSDDLLDDYDSNGHEKDSQTRVNNVELAMAKMSPAELKSLLTKFSTRISLPAKEAVCEILWQSLTLRERIIFDMPSPSHHRRGWAENDIVRALGTPPSPLRSDPVLATTTMGGWVGGLGPGGRAYQPPPQFGSGFVNVNSPTRSSAGTSTMLATSDGGVGMMGVRGTGISAGRVRRREDDMGNSRERDVGDDDDDDDMSRPAGGYRFHEAGTTTYMPTPPRVWSTGSGLPSFNSARREMVATGTGGDASSALGGDTSLPSFASARREMTERMSSREIEDQIFDVLVQAIARAERGERMERERGAGGGGF